MRAGVTYRQSGIAAWHKAKRFVVSAASKMGITLLLVGALAIGHFGHGHEGHGRELAGKRANAIPKGHPALPLDSRGLADGSKGDRSPTPRTVTLKSPQAAQKAGIQLVPTRLESVDEYIVGNAVVDYDQTRIAQLSARVPGVVWRVEKQVGQAVRAGEPLAFIEAAQVGDAKSELLQSLVSRQHRDLILQRLQRLGSAVAERQVRDAEAAAREARIRVFNAQQALTNLGLPIRLEDLEALSDEELVRRVRFLGLSADLVERLDPETTTANLIPLLAPFDGIVVGHDVALGEHVSPSDRQFVVADNKRMWIKLDVRQEEASRLRIGQRLTFAAEGLPEEIVSTVSWISTELDEQTRMVKVRAIVDNPRALGPTEGKGDMRMLRAQTFGTGRIRVDAVAQTLVVPKEAVQMEGTAALVFVQVGPQTFEARPVDVGIQGPGVAEVRHGLRMGEVVATAGSHSLKSELLRSASLQH